MKLNMILILSISLVALAMPALGSYQVLPLGNYNVSLDFGGKDVIVNSPSASSNLNTLTRSIFIQGANKTDYAIISIYEYQTPQTFDLKDRLWKLMKSYCTMVDIDPAKISSIDGFMATGYARVLHGFGKQVCYGGIAALPSGAVAQRDFAILAHFDNKTLNEQLVKTVHVEYVGKIIKI